VKFRGAADLRVRGAGDGVVAVALPSGAGAAAPLDAVRYALLGLPSGVDAVLDDGAPFAWVEAAFRLPDGAELTIFRGADRRGGVQVSLREDGGRRLTLGPVAVRARLESLLGASSDAYDRATFLRTAEGGARPGEDAPSPGGPGGASAEALRDFEQLVALGARIRRERTEAALSVDRIASDHDRAQLAARRAADAGASAADAQGPEAEQPSDGAAPQETRASRLVRRIAALDDVLAVLDVEVGRAARLLHRPSPPRAEARTGLGDRADPGALTERITRLGEAIQQAVETETQARSAAADDTSSRGLPPRAAALARRLREGDAAVASRPGAVRAVYFDRLPEGFTAEGDLAAFVREHAPHVAQVVLGRAATPAARVHGAG
jgi:hypothetical protein